MQDERESRMKLDALANIRKGIDENIKAEKRADS